MTGNLADMYIFKKGNRIIFSKISSTIMTCEDMNNEALLAEVPSKADNYNINSKTLNLNKAKMAPLASFVAVK
jgi:copper homeostasis protein (lipoprotein)